MAEVSRYAVSVHALIIKDQDPVKCTVPETRKARGHEMQLFHVESDNVPLFLSKFFRHVTLTKSFNFVKLYVTTSSFAFLMNRQLKLLF